MIYIKNAFKHLFRVIRHKHWVFKYCCMFGIPWRGIIHDLSKFHPVEFFESVKYWSESGSPINEAKKQKGYSNAWYHHRGRNRHHWEYWADNFESGTNCPVMPYEFTVEMLCDWLAAGKTYHGKSFTFRDEFEWWNNLKRDRVKMHPATKEYIGRMLGWLTIQENMLMNGSIQKFPSSEVIKRKSEDTYLRSVEMWKDHKREINS